MKFQKYPSLVNSVDEKVQYRNRLKGPVAQVIYPNIQKPE